MIDGKLPLHKGRNLLGISDEFVRNPALFTIQEGFQYGDFYKLSLPRYNLHIVTDPDILHHITVTREAHYEKSSIYWKQLRATIGRAMGSLDGEEWLVLRQMQTPFFTPARSKSYLPDVLAIARRHLDHWRVGTGKQLELLGLLSKMNTDIILKTIFGLDAAQDYGQIAQRIGDGQATISWKSKFPWRPWLGWLNGRNLKARQHLAFFRRYLKQSISDNQSRWAPGPDAHLLSRLLATPGLSATDIRNELIVHLGASTETAAVGAAWVLYLLSRHPEVLAKVRSEIDQTVGPHPLTPASAFQLPYTEQVIKESLRLYPPSYALVRDCIKEDTIKGVPVKPGDSFFICLFALHRHPRYWEQPNTFRPDRFAPEHINRIHPNTYHPFGAGKHHCIGRYLATPMLVLAIASFCRRFDFTLAGNQEKPPLSLSTLKPKGGLWMQVSERKQSVA